MTDVRPLHRAPNAFDEASTPILVEPRRPSALPAELVRLRLPDRPGALAAAAAHLASYGVDVLRVEVIDREVGCAVDDFLLAGERLNEALEELGPRADVLARRRGVDLGDPALAMAAACEAVAVARSERNTQRRVVAASLTLVAADAALLCARREDGMLLVLASTVAELPLAVDGSARSLIDSALESGECLTADGRIPWAPAALRGHLPGGAVAVVPLPSWSLILAVLRNDHSPFVATELGRLSALLRFAGESMRPAEIVTIGSRVRVDPRASAR